MFTDDESHLRTMERELYTTDIVTPESRRGLHMKKMDAPESWSDPKPVSSFSMAPKKPTSLFKKLFFGSLGLLIVALAVFAGSLFLGGNSISAKNVEITITAKTFVDGGEELPVDVTIVNKNKLPIELATLTLQYPEGNARNPDAVASISREIGTLGVGETKQESFSIKLYGQQNTVETITAQMQFDVAGSNAVYSNEGQFAVTIRTSPVILTLDAPDAVTPNQEIPLKFTVVGNGSATLSNTALVLQYPQGFTFTRGEPAPSFQNNVWDLGDLPPGTNRTVTAYGKFSGALNSSQAIRASVGAQNANNQAILDSIYSDVAKQVALATSFLAAQVSVEGKTVSPVTTKSLDSLQVSIPWQNTTVSPISNAEIRVHLSGNAYDSSRVTPQNGYFKSDSGDIIWSSQQLQDLATIAPGVSGNVSFSIGLKRATIVNPKLDISVSVSGYGTGGAKQSANDIAQTSVLLDSDLGLLSSTLHYSGPITNSGAMPPTRDKQTTYTVSWRITNARNRVTGVTVQTTLPTNVTWKNVVSPSSESGNLTYNSVTRALQWNAGDIPSGASAGKTVSFQVAITPSSQQVGSPADLTGPIAVAGRDAFTGSDLSVSKRQATTVLLNDTSSIGADGRVK